MRSRAAHRTSSQVRRRYFGLLGNGAFVLLGISLLGLAAVVALATMRAPTSGVPARAQAGSNITNLPMGAGDWIPLRSHTASDIIAAARRSELFNEHSNDGGDHVSNVSHLGLPVLVRAIQPPGVAPGTYPDFYVLPILGSSGAATDAAELQLNATHTAIHVIAIVTYAQPHAQGSVSHMNAATAQSTLHTQRHTDLRAGTAPTLVYFPADPVAQELGQVPWTGGGEFPADPIWLTPGADGHNYVVGTDGRVYDVAQLPMISTGK